MDPEIEELFNRFAQTQEFLRHSIESHDQQIGEMIERMEKRDAIWAERQDGVEERLNRTEQSLNRLTEQTALNFERLTTAMTALTEHTADHKSRIQALENR